MCVCMRYCRLNTSLIIMYQLREHQRERLHSVFQGLSEDSDHLIIYQGRTVAAILRAVRACAGVCGWSGVHWFKQNLFHI